MKISVRALAALLLISMLLCALPTNIFAHDESLHDHGTLVSDHDGHDHGDTDGVDSDFHSHVNWQSGSVSNGAPTSTTENKITLLNGTGIPGDVNADGTVNNKDAVALLRFLKSEKTAVDSDALDVNGDGAINTDDVTLLFRYVSGWSGVAVGYGSAWAEKCRHDLKNVPATAATCYENGNVEYWVCKICGVAYDSEKCENAVFYADVVVTSYSQHKFGEWQILSAPSCDAKGLKSRACESCDYEELVEIAKTEHKVYAYYTEKDPTCTEAGIETGTCSICENDVSRAIPALDHKASDPVNSGNKCLDREVGTVSCVRCGEILSSYGHSYVTTTVYATCTKDGAITKTCSRCNDTVVTVIESYGHQEGFAVTVKAATCTGTGEEAIGCLYCDYIFEETVYETSALGHSYVITETDSSYVYSCESCSESYVKLKEETAVYKITFVTEYGTKPETLYVEAGEKVVLPAIYADGYAFFGWYCDEACEKVFDGEYLTEDITLFAKWEKAFADETEETVVSGVATDFSFVVRAEGITELSKLNDLVLVVDTENNAVSVKAEALGDGTYKITPSDSYTQGGRYKIVLKGDAKFVDYDSDEINFTVKKDNSSNVNLRPGVVQIDKNDVYSVSEGEANAFYVMLYEDSLNVNDYFVIYEEYEENIVYVAKVYEEGTFDKYHVYRVDAVPNDELQEVFVDLEVYFSGEATLGAFVPDADIIENAEEEFRSSALYRQIEKAAAKFGILGSNGKYFYDYDYPKIETSFKADGTKINFTFKVTIEFKRLDTKTFELLDLFTVTFVVNNETTFNATVNLNFWQLLKGRFEIILNPTNKTTVGIYAKTGGKYTNDARLDVFKALFEEVAGSGKTDSLDSSTADADIKKRLGGITVWAFCVPISVELYNVFSFEMVGDIGAEAVVQVSPKIGVANYGNGVQLITGFDYTVSLHAYAIAKVTVSDHIGIKATVGWSGLLSVSGSIEAGPYAEAAGMLNVVVEWGKNRPMNFGASAGGYVELGIDFTASAEVHYVLGSKDWTYDKKLVLFFVGNTEMPLKFETAETTITKKADLLYWIDLTDSVSTSVVHQDLKNMKTVTKDVTVKYELVDAPEYATITMGGMLMINEKAGDSEYVDLKVKVIYKTVYKIIEVRVNIEHDYTDEFTCHDRVCVFCKYVCKATTEHIFSDWEEVSKGACAPEPYAIRICYDCRTVDYSGINPGEAQHHDYQRIDDKSQEPTCVEDGWLTYACVRPGCTSETKVEIIKSYGKHSLIWMANEDTHYQKCTIPGCNYTSSITSHVSDTEATCTEDQVCKYCQRVMQEALGHNDVQIPYKAPTCTEAGYYSYFECSVCHEKKDYEEIEPLGHEYVLEWNWQGFESVTVTATCKREHSETYTASVTSRISVDPTCIDSGTRVYTAKVTVDGEIYRDQKTETLKPLGHDIVSFAAQDPTCTAVGWYAYEICTRCSHNTRVDRMKLSHVGGVATCTSYAVCDVCHNTYGNMLDHKYGSTYYGNVNGHYNVCSCGEENIVVAHVPNRDAATETEAVICTVCAYVIKPATGHVTHNYTMLVANDTHHWYVCEGCSQPSEKTAHSGGESTSCRQKSTCEVCGIIYGDYGPHNTVALTNAEMHWEFCLTCLRVINKEAHYGGTATCKNQAQCDGCGKAYGSTLEHDFSTKWYSDTEKHYHMCKCGKMADFEEHIPDRTAPTETESVRCTVCAYVIASATGHVDHDYSILKHDGDSHWYQCSGCSAIVNDTSHNGGYTTCEKKAICTVCGAEYGDEPDHTYTLVSDESSHWYECDYCDFVGVKVDHEGGTATCTGRAVCSECNREYGDFVNHTYVTVSNDTMHWNVCKICKSTTSQYAHSGGEATCSKQAACDVCGKLYGDFKPHTPAEDDGDCTTAITCTVCGKTTTAAKVSHTGGVTSCDERAKCTVCGKEYGGYKAHSPYSDDGNCETPVKCMECGVTVTAAKTHSFTSNSKYGYDEGGHWRICSNSGCNETNKATSKEAHEFGEWTKSTEEGKHERECKCGYKEIADHIYSDDGDCTTAVYCSVCNVKIISANASHTGGEATCSKKAECTVCGKEYGKLKPHTPVEDDGNCATAISCKVCGGVAVEPIEHSFTDASKYEYDENGHWRICSNEGCAMTNKLSGTEAHKLGSWSESHGDLGGHLRKCVCGYFEHGDHTQETDDGDCTTKIVCSVCGAVTTPANISHIGGTATCEKKAECTVCGKEYGSLKDHTPASDDGNCATAVRCTVCDEIVIAAKSHSFGENSEYGYDDSGHWRICSNDGCSVANNTVAHSFGEWSTFTYDKTLHARSCVCGKVQTAKHVPAIDDGNCTTAVYCSVCDGVAIEANNIHSYTGDYESDASGHWRICSNENCNVSSGKAAHKYGKWTKDDNDRSVHTHVCSNCGYSESEPHNFEDGEYLSDDKYHWKKCADCSAEDNANAERHEGTVPNCVEKSVCYTCKNEYGGLAPNNHDYEFINTEDRVHYYKCTRCDDVTGEEAHSWENGVETTVVEKPGSIKEYQHDFIQKCTVCGYKVSTASHVCQHESAIPYGSQPATCLEVGYKAGLKCSCGHVYFSPEVIPVIPHSPYRFVEAKQPTCTEEGYKEHWLCEYCESRLGADNNILPDSEVVLPKTDHILQKLNGDLVEIDLKKIYNLADYPELVAGCVGKPATDETEGKSSFTCYACSKKIDSVRVIGHSLEMQYDENNHWQICVVEGCTFEKGAEAHIYAGNKCTVCGYEGATETTDLEFTLSPDGSYYVVTGIGKATVTDIIIPSTYKDVPVTAIGDGAFDGCKSITSVSIPEGITSIGTYAFRNCYALKSVVIPKSVTSVGNWAFVNCSSLVRVDITDLSVWCGINFSQDNTNPLGYAHNLYLNGELVTDLVIPEGVTRIGMYAFSGCTSIKSISIHSGVNAITATAFFGCTEVTRISVDSRNSKYSGEGNCLIDIKSKTLMLGCSTSVIPSSVSIIGSGAFYNCTNLKSIVIPSSVMSISSKAFYGCTGLNNFTIPDSVSYVGYEAFSGCSGIIEIVDNVEYVGTWAIHYLNYYGASSVTLREGTKGIASCTFLSAGNLTSIVIPGSVEFICAQAFDGCKYLSSVRFGADSRLKTIETMAFAGCSTLSELEIPESVTTIGSQAFDHCDTLIENINGIYYVDTWVIHYDIGLTFANLRDGTRGIAAFAFTDSTFDSIFIPESLKVVDGYAFYGASDFLTVYYSGSEQSWSKIEIESGNDPLINAAIYYGAQNGNCGFCGDEGMDLEHRCALCGDYTCNLTIMHEWHCAFCGNNICASPDGHIHCGGCNEIFDINGLCDMCGWCYECCTCGFVCENCGNSYDSVEKCSNCGLCNNCGSCHDYCPQCGVSGSDFYPCERCGFCYHCCTCLYMCERCGLNLNVNTRCDTCGYCDACCICNGSDSPDQMHPHEMVPFESVCDRPDEHYYCIECKIAFYRNYDNGYIMDVECKYCTAKVSYCERCGEVWTGLHVHSGTVDPNVHEHEMKFYPHECIRSEEHYYCPECNRIFYRMCLNDGRLVDIECESCNGNKDYYCPACGELTIEPHVKCGYCGEYRCVSDHTACDIASRCPCYELGKDFVHGKCGMCERWICQHEICDYCMDYIVCGSICNAMICYGGPDCNENCNRNDCTCESGCSNHKLCGRHTCQHTYTCEYCGMENISCKEIINHTYFCEICGYPMCERDHYECELMGKDCPACGEYGAFEKHRCEYCDGFKCDGAYAHFSFCEVCGEPRCKDSAHEKCRCGGCGIFGESHEICSYCNNYMCMGDHVSCVPDDETVCGSCHSIVNREELCYNCLLCMDCCQCTFYCGNCGFEGEANKFCRTCRYCRSCCKCNDSTSCPSCGIIDDSYNFCPTCRCCYSCCECKEGYLSCTKCGVIFPDNCYPCTTCMTCPNCCSCGTFVANCMKCNNFYPQAEICRNCGYCYGCCECGVVSNFCGKCGGSYSEINFCYGCGCCIKCCKCGYETKYCADCGFIHAYHNFCPDCARCFKYCTCGKKDNYCTNCYGYFPKHEFCYNCGYCNNCCKCSTLYYCVECDGYYMHGIFCINCYRCFDHCMCGFSDANNLCTHCLGLYADVDFCYDCMSCKNCCTCAGTDDHRFCYSCYTYMPAYDFCDDCGYCLKNCCKCVNLKTCPSCMGDYPMYEFCQYCYSCMNCCSCSSNMHPHSMTLVTPNCETNYGYEHYSCAECRKVFYRVCGINEIFDYECMYCQYVEQSYCSHTLDTLYCIGTGYCGSEVMHYQCYDCSLVFIEENSMTSTGLVECFRCKYGDYYCYSCNSVAERMCIDCRYCFNCCICEEKRDITRYCPRCRCDVMYYEGFEPDCINGGMYSTYDCVGCGYVYRIEDGAHYECYDAMRSPLGHSDSNGDYVCDSCTKLYSESTYCVICGNYNDLYHGCEGYYFQAVRAYTWSGITLKRTDDGHWIKVTITITNKTSGTMTYSIKNDEMYDYVDIAYVQCNVSSASGSAFVFEYVPTSVTVYRRNISDYINTGYTANLNAILTAPSYVMFTDASAYQGGNEANYNDRYVVGIINLPFYVCGECHGVEAVGNHGTCYEDGCGKNLCAGHVHGVCDHDMKIPTDISECGFGFHYYCPDCDQFIVMHEEMGQVFEYYVCDMCTTSTTISKPEY